MNKKTSVSALLLGGAILLSSCSIVAGDKSTETPKKLLTTLHSRLILGAIIPVVAGWALLYTRKSEKDFQSRYSAEKAKQVSKIFTKDYMKNLWYGIYDEIIGQRKQSSTLKCKDGKIFPSEDTPAYGALGTIDSYAAPLAESAKKFTEPFMAVTALWLALKTFATDYGVRAKNATEKVVEVVIPKNAQPTPVAVAPEVATPVSDTE